jgi:drug/metabolite transporter (DMT)-like permease
LLEHHKRIQLADGKVDGRPGKMLYLKTIGVGLLGYYVSSFLDFLGLKFISAGLERIVLFSYPTMVLLFASVLYGVAIRKYQWLALLLCYAGIALFFAADMQQGSQTNVLTGGLLILGCALTYAFYVLWSGRLIPAMGSAYFTSIAMMAATIAVLLHYWIHGSTLEVVMHFSSKVYGYLLLMAVFSTVVPALLISAALRRLGSGNVAIVSAIGPIAAFCWEVLSWAKL